MPHRKKSVLSTLVALCLMALCLTACSSKSGTSAPAPLSCNVILITNPPVKAVLGATLTVDCSAVEIITLKTVLTIQVKSPGVPGYDVVDSKTSDSTSPSLSAQAVCHAGTWKATAYYIGTARPINEPDAKPQPIEGTEDQQFGDRAFTSQDCLLNYLV